MDSNKSVSIIVLNYNGLELIEKNLPVLLKNIDTGLLCEIIVADNNSSDSSVKFIKEDFPQIRVLELKENHSFGEALNLAAKEAKNDLLLFLNNDVEVSANFIRPLIEHFKDNRVFGVTPKVLRPTQGRINESVITGAFKGGVISAEFSISQTRKIPDHAFETFSVCGAAMMVDKKKFVKIGGFDKMLRPFYYEETDLSYRALKHGWKIFYEPASVVYHQHNQSIGKYLKKSTALWSYRKNQYLTVWKNITDPWLMARHIIEMVIPKLLIPNLIEWKALFSAIKQLPEALSQRKKYPLTDREVFRKFDNPIRSLLLLRPDMIGDCVLITPAITLLRKKYPAAHIAVLASPYTREIFANNPDVNEIITDKKIPQNKFDASIHFYNEFEYALMAKRAKIPVRIGSSNKPLIGWLYTKRIDQKWTDLSMHEVEHNLLLLKALDIDISNPPPLNIGIQRTKSKDFTVGIHLGTGHGNRSWLPERYAEVADYLIKKLHAKVILTGSKKEIGLAEHVPGESLVGKTTLAELIKTIAAYDMYIGVDSGPLHIAAALKIPTVAIFPTKFVQPSEWGPWQTKHVIVRKEINCKRRCLPKECSLDDCLLQIEPQDIIEAIELLRGG